MPRSPSPQKVIVVLQEALQCATRHTEKDSLSRAPWTNSYQPLTSRVLSFRSWPRMFWPCWSVNWEHSLLALLLLSAIQWLHYCSCCTNSPVNLVLHPPLTCEKAQIYFNSFTSSRSSPSRSPSLVGNHGFWLGGVDFIPAASLLITNCPSAPWRS